MAELNEQGNIIARCPGCDGAKSTFEWTSAGGGTHGSITMEHEDSMWDSVLLDYRLFRCAGCGRGGIGSIVYGNNRQSYPGGYRKLVAFFPEVRARLPLPEGTPADLAAEFREGEYCYDVGCFRAAAGMFRSTLEKTLKLNGYDDKKRSLQQRIDDAAGDGIITESRRRRAQQEIRVLGNDVLHDKWRPIPPEDVEAARHYTQRVLEDLYDDREAVLKLLHETGRIKKDDNGSGESETT